MSNHFLKRYFTSPIINYLGRKKEKRHFTKAPIFIGGCARSGTSLLLSMLSAHPKIFCFPNETDAFTEWYENDGLKPVRQDRMYRSLLLNGVPKTANRWCEKRPSNIHFIPQILGYFGPETKFIHIIRDPRAVCTSRHPTKPTDYWVEPNRWVRDVRAGLDYFNHPQVFTLYYEDLILNTEKQMRLICEFIQEDYLPELTNWHIHAKVRSHASWFDGISAMNTGSLKKWKAPEHMARVLQLSCNKEIQILLEKLNQFNAGYHL